MAITIPQYGQSQVAPTVTGQPRANEDAPLQNFGGGQALENTAAAIDGLTKDTRAIYLEQKKQADNAIGQDVFAKLTQKKNSLIYDPNAGAMTRKGQDALSVVGDYGQQFNDYSDQVASTLQNDEQRAQFQHFKREVSDDLNTTLTKYTYGESQNLQKEMADTAIKTAQSDAVLNYHEPGKVEENVDLIANTISNTYKRAGMPQEVIDQKVTEEKSRTYSGVIDRMLVNGQDMQAKAYYESVKDQITGSDATVVEKSLEAGTMRGESQRQSDKIYSDNDSLSDALDDARQIQDPKLRDETVRRVKDRFSDDEQSRKTDDENRFSSASQVLEKSGGNLDAIPPQLMANMSSANRRAIETRSTQIKNGVEPASNGEEFYNLQQMAVAPELRDKFLGLNLLTYRHQITQNEMGELMKIQSSIRKSDGEADEALRGLRTRTQIVNETMKQLGVDKDPDDVLKINRQLDDQIEQFTTNSGKKPNGQDIQKMLDGIVVKAKDPSGGFFGMFNTGSAYTFKPGVNLTVDIDDIPQSEKQQITKALNSKNIPVTDDKIVDLYSRKLNGTRARGGQ